MFTGQLGTPASKLGYIVLGAARSVAMESTRLRIKTGVRRVTRIKVSVD